MENNKLISMVDFVLLLKNEWNEKPCDGVANNLLNHDNILIKIDKYANFLKQELKLLDFVPTDKDGDVLEEPKWESVDKHALQGVDGKYYEMVREYEEAVSKVIFSGFTLMSSKCVSNQDLDIYFDSQGVNGYNGGSIRVFKLTSIEKLVELNVTLTESKAKSLGLI